MSDIRKACAEAFLRVQRRDIYSRVSKHKSYIKSGSHESFWFRKRLPMPRKDRATAETTGKELLATHLEDINKGYPKGFTNYQTYDERRNKNYEKNNRKFRADRYPSRNF